MSNLKFYESENQCLLNLLNFPILNVNKLSFTLLYLICISVSFRISLVTNIYNFGFFGQKISTKTPFRSDRSDASNLLWKRSLLSFCQQKSQRRLELSKIRHINDAQKNSKFKNFFIFCHIQVVYTILNRIA